MIHARIPALDGIRGAAALMVVTAHYFGETPHGLAAFTWGWLGVSLFFVLSGFLVGGIVLDQSDHRGFLKGFWVKRAARILPAYAVVLTVVFLARWAFPDRPWKDDTFPAWTYLTFTQNIVMAVEGVEGFRWLTPTWTLAVEEQFYLLIPLLIGWLPRRALAPTLWVLWAVAGLVRLTIHESYPIGALTLLPSRMDLLLAGVIAAMALRRADMRKYLTPLRVVPLVAAIAVLAIGLTKDHQLFVVLMPTIVSLGAGAYILALVLGAPEGRRFEGPLMGFFGAISYGLYLFHQPIAGLMHGLILGRRPDIDTASGLAVTFAAVVVSIAAAWMSWRWLETPILIRARTLRNRARPPASQPEG